MNSRSPTGITTVTRASAPDHRIGTRGCHIGVDGMPLGEHTHNANHTVNADSAVLAL